MASLEWMNEALCAEVGTEVFFPDPGYSGAEAISVCRECPVRLECLDHVLTLDSLSVIPVAGIWGGTTAAQRRAMKGTTYRSLAS